MALYDYQAAADDEISFDPNDVITNIEMVSERLRDISTFLSDEESLIISLKGKNPHIIKNQS